MTTPTYATILDQLREVNERLDLQSREMTALRAFLDTQFKRIASIQAELDVMPRAHDRRQAQRVAMMAPPATQRGNGRSQR